MSGRAALYIDDVTVGDARHRRYTLDCEHAITTVDAIAPLGEPDAIGEAEMIAMVQARHAATCRCGRQYVRGARA